MPMTVVELTWLYSLIKSGLQNEKHAEWMESLDLLLWNYFFNANINESKMFCWSFQELWDVFK